MRDEGEPTRSALRQRDMKTFLAAAALLLASVIVGCNAAAGPSGAAPAGPAGVVGRTFISTGVSRNGQPVNLVPNTQVRLVFNADGNLGATAGCNSIGGTYRIAGGKLVFEGGGMTEMGCDEPRHQQDDWLAGFLASGPTIELTGNDLRLAAGEWAMSLADREVVEPDLALVGPVWTVNSIFDGGAVSSIPDDAVATLQFMADGRVLIRTGCNDAGGTFEVVGSRIAFRDIVTTDVACQGAAGQLEEAVTRVLGANRIDWSIEASGLTLMAGETGLGLGGAN
jgi:heat shock protein HslJ